MTNIAMLIACLLAGVVLRQTRRMPDGAHAALNAFIIHISLPALILAQLHRTHLAPELALPVLMPWLLFGLSAAVFFGLRRVLTLTPATTGALVMTAGLANTSFVGLPMIEAFYGPAHLSTGILIDQFGTYLVLSTLGITVACACSSGRASWKAVARRVATFPPFIALLLAVALLPVDYPAWLDGLLGRLGLTLAPLALTSVGLQLRLDQLAGNRVALGLGLGFKLVLGPLLILGLYAGLLSWRGDMLKVTVFEAAMGPQIGAAIVAVQYGLNAPLVTQMVGLGITLSFLTLPAWHYGLSFL